MPCSGGSGSPVYAYAEEHLESCLNLRQLVFAVPQTVPNSGAATDLGESVATHSVPESGEGKALCFVTINGGCKIGQVEAMQA